MSVHVQQLRRLTNNMLRYVQRGAYKLAVFEDMPAVATVNTKHAVYDSVKVIEEMSITD
jgi:hypothetical protein